MNDSALTGQIGEQLAADYLSGLGFTVLERGWRSGHLEVDIIARKGDKIHIVEVKCRRNTSSGIEEFAPEFAMNKTKCDRLLAAAGDYLRLNDFEGELSLDLIAVNITPSGSEIRFYEGVQW